MRQQIRSDGVDGAQAQGTVELILSLPGNLTDSARLFQDPLRLGDDTLADRGDTDLPFAAFEQAEPEFLLELFNRHAERRLADEAGLGGTTKVPLSRHGNDVPELVQGHNCGILLTKSDFNGGFRVYDAG